MPGDSLIDWGGAQRWFFSSMPATEVRGGVREAGVLLLSDRNLTFFTGHV